MKIGKHAKRVDQCNGGMTRRERFMRIGAVAGASVMYPSMSALGYAKESVYAGPIAPSGAPANTQVLVLGAGMARLVAAYETGRSAVCAAARICRSAARRVHISSVPPTIEIRRQRSHYSPD
jgi:hypothetical protein